MTHVIPLGRVALAATVLLAVGPAALGQSSAVSINFVATAGPNPGANLLPTEAAGFVPLMNWNNVGAANGTTTNLVNHTGATTGVSVTVAGSPNTWSIPAANLPNSPDGRMMQGYADSNDTSTTTITISGLTAAGFTGTFHIYVYAVGDSNSGRNGDYTVGSQTFRLLDDQQFNGTFRLVNQAPTTGQPGQSGNYMDFTVNNLDSVNITAMASQDVNGFRAPINGVQVVMPVPEPGAILLAAGPMLGGVAAWRRRKHTPPA